MPLNLQLFLLHHVSNDLFKEILSIYKELFPFVEDMIVTHKDITSEQILPTIFIKETNVHEPIPLEQMSSGMLKALLIMTDIILLKDDSVYLIDEYENSLGMNAINFLPDFIDQYGDNRQFIVTTHHPTLMNKVKIEDWQIVNRNGQELIITDGKHLKDKYGKSHHSHYTQLINDSIYYTNPK